MATCRPKPGRLEDVLRASREHAQALRRQPGCRATYVLSSVPEGTQVSISVFDSESALTAALAATREVIAAHHLDDLLDGPPTFQIYRED